MRRYVAPALILVLMTCVGQSSAGLFSGLFGGRHTSSVSVFSSGGCPGGVCAIPSSGGVQMSVPMSMSSGVYASGYSAPMMSSYGGGYSSGYSAPMTYSAPMSYSAPMTYGAGGGSCY